MTWSVVPASAIASTRGSFRRRRCRHQRRAGARTDNAMRLVAAEHGDRIGAAQFAHGTLHGVEQVALVQAVDEVGDDLRSVWLSKA